MVVVVVGDGHNGPMVSRRTDRPANQNWNKTPVAAHVWIPVDVGREQASRVIGR